MIHFKEGPKKPANPVMDLTPLIDVVFLLLIFFMVSTTFLHENLLSIELPKTTHEEGVRENIPVVIAIDSQSNIYWQKEGLEGLSELEERVRATPNILERTLVIQADRETPHGTVIQVFDVLKRNKVKRLSIATDLLLKVDPSSN